MEPIHIAAKNGHTLIVKYILSQSKRIIQIAKEPIAHTQSQPLHLAAYGGHFPIVEAILDAGGTLMAKNRFGDTFLHIAIRHGQLEFIKQIV